MEAIEKAILALREHLAKNKDAVIADLKEMRRKSTGIDIFNYINKNNAITEKVYEFWYNDCVYESAAACISIHRTKKGAEIALSFHKEQKRKDFNEVYENHIPSSPFGTLEAWGIEERDILE